MLVNLYTLNITMLVIAAIATVVNSTIQNIFFDFDKLIFLEFFMCEKYGIFQ